MSDSMYLLRITSAETEQITSLAYGNLAEITFIAKRQIKELTGSSDQYVVRFVEVEYVGQDAESNGKRTVTQLAADGDTVAAVLKRKLAAEKRQQSEDSAPFDGDALPEPGDVEAQ